MDILEENHTTQNNRNLTQILFDFNLNLSQNPRGTDKGDYKSYVNGFYEKEFEKRKGLKNRLLEVGVRSGASVALWANYFSSIEIIGVDIVDVGTPNGPQKEYLDYPFVEYFVSDAYDENFANSLSGEFSILIDDGPHSLSSQKRFLELYLPKLSKDGVLVIEDVIRSYRDCFALARTLPNGNKYTFEVYNFDEIKKDGGCLFVVRHNNSNKIYLWRNFKLLIHCVLDLAKVLIRRISRGDFSVVDRRIDK